LPTIDTRRALAALPVLALATALLAGCSAGGATPKDAGDGGTVKQSTSPSKTAVAPLDTSKFDACTLLPTADAETLVSNKVIAPIKVSTGDVASCTYQGDPNGPLGQVEIYVGDGAKQQLTIDRDNLRHTFTQPTGLGDEAWQEEGWIWSRKGTTWISIRIVVLRDSSLFVTPLQTAMATALKNLPNS
jgi:Protein of unknown function (DUF3558)